MGTTLGNIHIYGETDGDKLEALVPGYLVKRFSEGWTSLFSDELRDPELLLGEARKLSKNTGAPVVAFYCFDDDAVVLTLYRNGKSLAECGASCFDIGISNRKPAAFAENLGIDDPSGKRLKQMLKCEDIDQLIGMLEEYLGVCLYADAEFIEFGNESEFVRRRGRALFDAYMEQSNR